MGQLKDRSYLVLQASTLVEVLVAMTILLTVFAAGMMLFANLTRSSASRSSKEAVLRMQDMAVRYSKGEELPVTEEDGISFFVEEEPLPAWGDLKKIKVYAQRTADGLLLDSVIMIRKQDEQK